MSLFDIRTWGDIRAFVHSAVPTAAAAFVGYGVLTETTAALWVALALAVFDPLLSRANTVDGFRKWLYPALGAGSAVAIGYGIFSAADWAPWLSIITLAVGGGTAAANTETSTGRHARNDG